MAKVRVGINGFGRIGRLAFRAGFDEVEIVGINNIADPKLSAHLLKYDSTHGTYPKSVEAGEGFIIVDGKKIPMSATKDPAQIPWGEWGCDVVFECTGAFKTRDDHYKHIKAGAKKVLVSAPANEADFTLVYGVNHEDYDPSKHEVISNASCTTNCLVPVVQVLHQEFGVEKGMVTTIHSFTNDQVVLDANHKDFRRARTASSSMIPTTTGAAKAVGLVLPELKGKIDGVSVRVPTPNVSLVDLVFESKKSVSIESINEAFQSAASGALRGVLGVESNPLVSMDFNGNPLSSIVDLPSTMVIGDKMAKVFSWYDNETGFSHRMVDVAKYVASRGW